MAARDGRQICRYCVAFLIQDWTARDKKTDGFTAAQPHTASTVALVEHLLKVAKEIDDKEYVLVQDSGFTTLKVARAVLDLGCHLVGAVKPQFSGVPTALLLHKTEKHVDGFTKCARTLDGKLLLQGWHDRGPVNILSTYHVGVCGIPGHYRGGDTECVRRWREEAQFQWEKRDVPCPEAVRTYQLCMKGVDRNDQVSVRWWFFALVS